MEPASKPRDSGGSFVEIVVCIALAGVVLLAVSVLFLSGRRSADSADKYRVVNVLARDRLEELLLLPFDDPRLADGPHDDDLPPTMREPSTGSWPSEISNPYRRSWRVRRFALPPSETIPPGAAFTPVEIAGGARCDYKRVDVTVEVFAPLPGSGRIAARVSAIRANPDPGS